MKKIIIFAFGILTSVTCFAQSGTVENYQGTGINYDYEVVYHGSDPKTYEAILTDGTACQNAKITIPDKIHVGDNDYDVIKIKSQAFKSNNSIVHVIISDGVKEIKTMAFWGCSILQKIEIPSSIQTIEANVFGNCNELIYIGWGIADYTKFSPSIFPDNKLMTLFVPNANKDTYLAEGSQWKTDARFGDRIYGGKMTDVEYGGMTYLCASDSHDAILVTGKDAPSVTIPSDFAKMIDAQTTITYYVRNVGRSAFKNINGSLNSISIPNGVTVISNGAFQGCTKLANLELPSDLKIIGANAFDGCSALQKIVFPATLETIYSDAFKNSGLIYIGWPFTNPSNFAPSYFPNNELMTLFVPNANREYYLAENSQWKNDNRFEDRIYGGTMETVSANGMTYLCASDSHDAILVTGKNESLTIASSFISGNTYNVRTIGKSAFYSCDQIQSLTISEGITSISSSAFQGCSALETLSLPNSLRAIGKDAFKSCSNLQRLVLPSNLKTIGSNAFNSCGNLIYICLKQTESPIYGPTVFPKNDLMTLFIPAGSGDNYFGNLWSTHQFGNRVYKGDMIEKTDDDGMTYLCASSSCDAILITGKDEEDVTVPTFFNNDNTYYVKSVGKAAFNGKNTNLKNLTIQDGVTTISNMAFQGCSKIENVSLPSDLEIIGSNAFNGCSNLVKLDIPSTLRTIGSNAFYSCTNIIHISCRVSDPSILGPTNLPGNEMMTLYVPQNSLSSYMDVADWKNKFQGRIYGADMSLEYMSKEVPIEDMKYIICSSGTGTNVATLYKGKDADPIVVPPTIRVDDIDYIVTGIDKRAFYNSSTNLVNLTISENVKAIGPEAFRGCTKLVKIKLPNSLETIRSNAFNGCSNLATIDCKIGNPFTIDENVFSTKSSTTLYVPTSSKSKYQSATGWGFSKIVECDIMEEFTKSGITYICLKKGDSYTAKVTKGAPDSNGLLTIPSSVKSDETSNDYAVNIIGSSAFSGRSSITELRLPEGIETIEANAFRGCSGLVNLVIPHGVTVIGDGSFSNCTSLQTIEFPSTLIRIGNQAFDGCGNINTITSKIKTENLDDLFGSGYTINNVFTSSISPTIYVPKTTKSAYAEKWSSKFNENSFSEGKFGQYQDGNLWIYEYIDDDITKTATLIKAANRIEDNGHLRVYGTIQIGTEDYVVTEIGESAFINYEGVEAISKLTIDDNITKIGANAFQGYSNLKSIWLPQSLTAIRKQAFSGCNKITYICNEATTPAAISDDAFTTQAYNAAYLFVPEGNITDYIGADGWKTFKNSKVIEGKFDGEVTTLEPTATSDMSTMTYISLTTTVEEPYKRAILISSDKTPQVIAQKILDDSYVVTNIGASVFKGKAFKEVEIPSGIIEIESNAFENCTQLKKVELPSTLKKIGNNAFTGCDNLTIIQSYISNPSPIDESVFSNYTADLYVPKNYKSNYENTASWNKFKELGAIYEGERGEQSIDGFTYVYATEEEKARITKADNPNQVSITIPGTVNIGGKDYTITTFDKSLFAGKTKITDLTLGEGLESIGDGAFQGCTGLKKIDLPSTLKTIGDNSFAGCEAVAYICTKNTVPSTLGSNVFEETVFNNAELYVPSDNVTDYTTNPQWLFTNVIGGELNEVKIGDMTYYCVTVQNYAYLMYSSTKIADLTINATIEGGYNVTRIAENAFSGNGYIKNVIIEEGIESIGKSAFKGCGNLEKVELSSKITYIGDNAFTNCNRLNLVVSRIEYPTNITDVFPEYKANLSIPEGSKERYNNVTGWDKFKLIYEGDMEQYIDGVWTYLYITGPKTATLVKGTPKEKELTIPTTVTINNVGYTVTAIGDDAIVSSTVENLTISGDITSIGSNAFKGCSNITRISLPSKLESIKDNAFSNCGKLIFIQCAMTNPKAISETAFAETTYKNATLFVPSGASSKYTGTAGWKFSKVLEGNISDVTKDDMSYICVPNLEIAKLIKGKNSQEVKIPSKITDSGKTYKVVDIDIWAFSGMTSLEKVVVPENVETIGLEAFKNCSKLKSIELPATLKSIGSNAFQNCGQLTLITCAGDKPAEISDSSLPSNKITINVPVNAKDAYQKAEYWKEYDIVASISSVSGDDDNNSDLVTYVNTSTGDEKTVAITDGTELSGEFEIPELVKYGDTYFTVTAIAAGGFEGNEKLEAITIPNTVGYIGESAFKNCTGLKSVTVYWVTPLNISGTASSRGTMTRSGGSSIFEGVNMNTCILYVPAGSEDAYRTADVWKEFKNIRTIGTTAINGVVVSDGAPFDVYNMQGRKVRDNVTSFEGLPSGIYIVNGKKVMVK